MISDTEIRSSLYFPRASSPMKSILNGYAPFSSINIPTRPIIVNDYFIKWIAFDNEKEQDGHDNNHVKGNIWEITKRIDQSLQIELTWADWFTDRRILYPYEILLLPIHYLILLNLVLRIWQREYDSSIHGCDLNFRGDKLIYVFSFSTIDWERRR